MQPNVDINIHQNTDSVNKDFLTLTNAICNAVAVQMHKEYKQYFTAFNYTNVLLNLSKNTPFQQNCPMAVPHPLCVQPTREEEKPKKKHKEDSALIKFAEIMNKGMPSDASIKSLLRNRLSKILYIGTVVNHDRFAIFQSNSKFTQRYATRQQSKLRDEVAFYVGAGYETFGLTLTYGFRQNGESRKDAWSNYTKHLNTTLEDLRKHHGLKYIWVKESTAKGYPHAHIVLAFPKGTIKGYKNLQPRKFITKGWLYAKIKKTALSPVFNLQAIKGKGVAKYLAKYISKNDTTDYKILSEKEDAFTKTERKSVFAALATSVTHTRCIGFCKRPKIDNVLCEERGEKIMQNGVSFEEEFIECMKKIAYGGQNALAEARAYLIKLCINSPCLKVAPTYVVGSQVFSDLKIKDWRILRENPTNYAAYFVKEGHQTGCAGCLYSNLHAYILGYPSPIFNKFVNDFERLKTDDYYFFECMANCLETYLGKGYLMAKKK